MNALSAALGGLGAIDIGIIAVAATGLLIALIRGFASSMKSASWLIGLAAAVACVVFAYSHIAASAFYSEYTDALSSALSGKCAALGRIARVGEGSVIEISDGAGAWVPLVENFGGVTATVIGFAQGAIISLLGGDLAAGNSTLADLLAVKFGGYIGRAVVFIVVWIVVTAVLSGLTGMLAKGVRKNKGARSVDRIAGLLICALIIVGLLGGAVIYAQMYPQTAVGARLSPIIDGSAVLSWIKAFVSGRGV